MASYRSRTEQRLRLFKGVISGLPRSQEVQMNRTHIAEGVGYWFKVVVIGTAVVYTAKAAYAWATKKKEGSQ